MAKTIYIIRHAKSSWDYSDLSDFDRPLNKRGERDAPQMGELLADKGVNPQLIISSPANRAITTARIIGDALGISSDYIREDRSIYGASAFGILSDVVFNLDEDLERVMLFGHNPGFTMLANILSNARIDNIPTCGFAEISFEVGAWNQIGEGKGKLISFEYPKKHFY